MVHGPDKGVMPSPWGLTPAAALRYPNKLDIERANDMAKVSPFHSAKPGTGVHHNDNRCTEGNNIVAPASPKKEDKDTYQNDDDAKLFLCHPEFP